MPEGPWLRGTIDAPASGTAPRPAGTVTVITPTGAQVAVAPLDEHGGYATPLPAPGSYLLVCAGAGAPPSARWVTMTAETARRRAPTPDRGPVDPPAAPHRPRPPADRRALLYGLVVALLTARLRLVGDERDALTAAAQRLAGSAGSDGAAQRAARELLEPLSRALLSAEDGTGLPVPGARLGAAGTQDVAALLRPLVAALVADLTAHAAAGRPG